MQFQALGCRQKLTNLAKLSVGQVLSFFLFEFIRLEKGKMDTHTI